MTTTHEHYEMPDVLKDGDSTLSRSATARNRPRRRFWILLIAILVVPLALVLVFRESTEPLTRESIENARRLWRSAGLQDYELQLEVRTAGGTLSRYDVSVRDGEVVQLRLNGLPAESRRPADFSVPGLFETLERESDLAGEANGPFSATGAQAIMRVRFDENTGHLKRYLRSVTGSRETMEIRTVSFKPVTQKQSRRPGGVLPPARRPLLDIGETFPSNLLTNCPFD